MRVDRSNDISEVYGSDENDSQLVTDRRVRPAQSASSSHSHTSLIHGKLHAEGKGH